jgi:branched-chain amino acid transport system permease protein
VTTSVTSHWMAAVGVIFMVFVLFFPRGVWGSILHWLRPHADKTRVAA